MAAVDPARARRRIAAVALVALGVLAVGAIVATSVSDRADRDLAGGDPVAAVRAAPATVRGTRVSARLTTSTGGALQLQVVQTGVFDPAARRADLVLTGLGSGTARLVVDGSTLYAKTTKELGGKEWGRASLDEAGPIGMGAGQASPTQIDTYLGVLANVTGATDRGIVTIEGKRLRHYTATVSRAAVAQASPLFARAAGATEPSVDVHLDEEGVPRLLSVASETAGTTVEIGVRIIEVGVKEPIQLPPPASVADVGFGDLTAALQG